MTFDIFKRKFSIGLFGNLNLGIVPMSILFLFLVFNNLKLQTGSDRIPVKKCKHFSVDGQGSNPQWTITNWVNIPQRKIVKEVLETSLKILYSDSGVYFLFRCQDRKITASFSEDFLDLWKEDVVEVFLWPDEDFPVYFEYEISPLNRELVLLVPNLKGKFFGWRPWHYDGNRKVQHETWAKEGNIKSGATVEEWRAEFFIPFALLTPLGNVPPEKGIIWRANFYRGDYDLGEWENWAWQPIEKRFHEYQKFGYLYFE